MSVTSWQAAQKVKRPVSGGASVQVEGTHNYYAARRFLFFSHQYESGVGTAARLSSSFIFIHISVLILRCV